MQVSGRSYPVEVRYRPLQENAEGEMQDIPQAVCTALDELAVHGLRGDILVFLPGEREIRDTAEALRKHHPVGVEILPLFSRLSAAEQDRVFKTSGKRRVVLATNVAETSLTVPNIGYVIDSGLARINRYSIRQKVEQLRVEKIARAAANQRAGRCGRVMSGICVRLYDEPDFLARTEYTDAEIFRVSLATVILRMSALGLGEIEQFPFIEPPGSRSIADGYQLLAQLNAITEDAAADDRWDASWQSCRSTRKSPACCWREGNITACRKFSSSPARYHCRTRVTVRRSGAKRRMTRISVLMMSARIFWPI